MCHRVGDTCTSPLRFQVSRKQAREEEIPFQSLDQGSEMDDGGGVTPMISVIAFYFTSDLLAQFFEKRHLKEKHNDKGRE